MKARDVSKSVHTIKSYLRDRLVAQTLSVTMLTSIQGAIIFVLQGLNMCSALHSPPLELYVFLFNGLRSVSQKTY